MPILYEYTDYKKYLSDVLSPSGATRGSRSRLAQALKCQTGFISQVLNGRTHFSLEHTILISEFLNHDELESSFLVLLVQLGRAGSTKLENHFKMQIHAIQERRKLISQRVGQAEQLSEKDQMRYYSAWYYSAIHVLTAIPKFQNKIEISKSLKLSLQTVSNCLEFLKKIGLISEMEGTFKSTAARIHLDKDSSMINQHHSNWRIKAIQSIDECKKEDFHLSGVWSLAEKDVEQIRNLLLKTIEKSEPILRESQDEVAFGIGIDFFRLA